ncbi:hypothetical protein BOTCAL_0013g00110 [Botryotinia calthae]|uniref:Uncharacterized protein n=1 Tax=Botryotinia calthae TaxID=38488 RepID=A0A4Y8DIH5_9HELO|nr:hypothetical protein BOTCAL_0013g00110 [Botryotinia calthae]
MASNGIPRKPPKKEKNLSFSTANIGTSPSQGSAVTSLTSPSQLVLGYSAGQLIRTPPVISSFQIEDRQFSRSPTPRSKIARPRAIVNHLHHTRENLPSSPHPLNPHSLFAITGRSLQDLSNRAMIPASDISVLAKMATLNGGVCDALAANLIGETSTLQPTDTATIALPQPMSNSNAKDLSSDKILSFSGNEENREKNQATHSETPATPAQEPLLTTTSEFPTNTNANQQQWKAAVKAIHPPRNPFHLNIPTQIHHRTDQYSQGMPHINNNHHHNRTTPSHTNAYIQMMESVEKANGNQGNPNLEAPAAMMGRNLFSESSGGVALESAPDFEANFREMMETLENSKPGELMFGLQMSVRAAEGGLEDMKRNALSVQPGNKFTTPDCSSMVQMTSPFQMQMQMQMKPVNQYTAQENVMDAGCLAGGMASGVGGDTPGCSSMVQMRSPFQTSIQMQPVNHPTTPDHSSTLQIKSPFQTSIQPANHSTTQQNITNSGNPFEGTSLSTGQETMIDPLLGSDFSNTAQMRQSRGQEDTMNNGGYDSGVQDDNALSTDIIGDFAREYGSANNSTWLTAGMNESSAEENLAASMIGVSPSTHANTTVDMVGSSTQAPLPNVDSYPMDRIKFTGNNNGDLSSVSGGYNMNFAPNTSSQVMDGTFSSGLGPNTRTYQQSSPQQVVRQSSAIPIHGHASKNSMGSGFGHTGSHVLSSPNHPVQPSLDLRRSATPTQPGFNYSNTGSPAAVNAIARSKRSSSTALATPEISFDETSPNPLHPASFHQDTPGMPDATFLPISNPLHPPSFHQPTPRASWPTSRVPIPPNPAVSGNTPGYFEPSQILNTRENANSNKNLMSLNRDMLMQFNPAFQQHQMLNRRGQNNLQLPQQIRHHMQPDQFEFVMNQAAVETEANNLQEYTPPVSPPISIMNYLFSQRASQFEYSQPLTEESAEKLSRYQLAAGITTSLQDHNLNSPMPLDGKPLPQLPNYLTPDRRSKNIVDLADRPLALNNGTPNLRGIDRYNHDFVEIWGPAGTDWCADCKRAGKNILAVAVPEKNTNPKENNKGKRPAKDPAGPGPTPKKQARSSSNSPMKMTRSATSGAKASYDRYAPLSEESNIFGDPREILSPIDNMLINPFMHNLTCRGSSHRQIDTLKTKICLPCKLRKMEIITHGCHDEFTHIVALNMDGQWQIGYGREFSDAGLRDGEGGLGAAAAGCFGDFRFDVSQDLNEGNMTVEEINSIVNVGLNAGGVQSSSSGLSSGGMNASSTNPSGMQPTGAHTDGMSSRRNSIVDSRTNLRMNTSVDCDIDSDLHCDMNSILNSSMDSMFGNDDFSWGRSGWLSTHSTSTSNSAVLLPTPAPTSSITTPSPRDETHDHHTHMNRLPHRPISKSCMICPATSVFLCDGCPLTLCEKCRYSLRDAKGWLNNLIYSNGVNHNRNDAFLLRSDDGGYHDYGKFWPIPVHVNGKGVFGDGGH